MGTGSTWALEAHGHMKGKVVLIDTGAWLTLVCLAASTCQFRHDSNARISGRAHTTLRVSPEGVNPHVHKSV